MKKILTIILLMTMLLALSSCNKNKKTDTAGAAESNAMPDTVSGKIVFADFGTVEFELYPNKAKQSTLNFIYLAKQGFYDGIVVHRLVNDFVIQAGAYESGYVERPFSSPYTIIGEFSANGIDNPVKHVKGTLSWARPSDFNGASTQFFICTDDRTAGQLDGNYAAFGIVTSGFDVLDRINAEETVAGPDVPVKEIMIESVTINSDYDFPEPDFQR